MINLPFSDILKYALPVIIHLVIVLVVLLLVRSSFSNYIKKNNLIHTNMHYIPEIINDIIEKIFKTCSVIIFLVGIIYSINLL